MTNINLHNYQFDGIKIQTLVSQKNNIKWENLEEHPTLKKNYCLKSHVSPYAKNFRLYLKGNGQAVINLSIPYFLEGHNYLATPYNVLCSFKNIFLKLVGIDLNECRVLEYEFGAYESIDIDARKFIKSVVGVANLELEKSNSTMKMFGDSSKGIHYKIYDAVANAKRKKTFSRSNYTNVNLIKHELKITKTHNLWGKEVFSDGFIGGDSFYEKCKQLLNEYRQAIIFKEEILYKPLSSDLTNIVFTCLKSLEHKSDTTIVNLINQVLEASDLNASQRSKRRKSILQLDKMYNQATNR